MRTIAGGGLGTLAAMILIAVVGAAQHGVEGVIYYVVCVGWFLVPLGFVIGCVCGAIVSLVRPPRGDGGGVLKRD